MLAGEDVLSENRVDKGVLGEQLERLLVLHSVDHSSAVMSPLHVEYERRLQIQHLSSIVARRLRNGEFRGGKR